jgi:hypothetical protein
MYVFYITVHVETLNKLSTSLGSLWPIRSWERTIGGLNLDQKGNLNKYLNAGTKIGLALGTQT